MISNMDLDVMKVIFFRIFLQSKYLMCYLMVNDLDCKLRQNLVLRCNFSKVIALYSIKYKYFLKAIGI